MEVPADALESVKNTFDAVVLGTVTDTAKIELNGKALDLDDLIETWNGKLPQRDWAALENNWASAYTGKGGEVH